MMRQFRMSGGRGFTLMELLVVVAIIGTLIALLMPALNGAKRRAQDTACKAALKGLGTGVAEYLDENDRVMADIAELPSINSPPHTPAPVALATQVVDKRAFRCAGDNKGYVQLATGKGFNSWYDGEGTSYEFNGGLAGRKIASWGLNRVLGDTGTYVFACFDWFHAPPGSAQSKNLLFADFHVGTIQDIVDKAGNPGAATQQ